MRATGTRAISATDVTPIMVSDMAGVPTTSPSPSCLHQQRVAAHNRGWATVWAAVRDGRVLFGVSGDGLQRIWMRIPVGVRRPLVAGAPSQHIDSARCRFEYDTNTRMDACCRAPSDGHSRRRNEACVYALPTTTWVQLVGHGLAYGCGRCSVVPHSL